MAHKMTVMAALFLIALVLETPSAGASAGDGSCLKGCDKFKKDPVSFSECKDDCALEADFKMVTKGFEDCNNGCRAKGVPAEVDMCKEVCRIKADSIVGVVATRACYRDCAANNKDPSRVKMCEGLCDRTGEKGVAVVEQDAAARLGSCFKRCAVEGGKDAARVNACKEACPLAKLAKALQKGKTASATVGAPAKPAHA